MAEMYGTFEMEVRGNTLFIKVVGPLGLEEVNWLKRQMTEKYLQHLTKPWAILGDATEWELYTPEVKEELEAFSAWMVDQGMAYNVLIAPHNSVKQAAAKELTLGEVNHYYVTSKEEAIVLLSEKNLWGEKKA